MRRLIAALSSVAVGFGMLVGVAAPATAADLGTVTVSYDASSAPSFVSFTPTSLSGGAGDTFTLVNTRNNSVSSYVSIEDGTGSVTLGGTSCTTSSACAINDSLSPPTSGVFTVVAPGTFTVYRSTGGAPTSIGTLTISSSGASSSESTDPALVYPTLYLDANGGTCSGAMQFTKHNGQNGTVVLPTQEACGRSGYTLGGWMTLVSTSSVFGPGATIPVTFGPGTGVPIGNESFTLDAVWVPDGVEVTYDANVGTATACLDGAGADVAVSERTSTAVLPVTASLASSAPCQPDNAQLVLAGWATSGDGPVAYGVGVPVADTDLASGSRVDLYAVWQPTITVTCTATRRHPLVAFSCTDFGDVPVGYRAVVEVRVSNESRRAAALVAQPLPASATRNGSLELVPTAGDCSSDVQVPGGGSCTLHYAWTPASAGALSAEGVLPVVCFGGNPNQCYRPGASQSLRGNAYIPESEEAQAVYGISITADARQFAEFSHTTLTGRATLNGRPAARQYVAIVAGGGVGLERDAPSSSETRVLTDGNGSFTVPLYAVSGKRSGYVAAAFGDQVSNLALRGLTIPRPGS